MDPRVNGLQRECVRRGFSISHQKVVLEIDFAGILWGYTDITIVPTSSELRTLHLHSRQCQITSVTVASIQADFTHYDPLSNLSISSNDPKDCHYHPELKRKVYTALQESDEGELSIAIPKDVSFKQSSMGYTGSGLVSEAATPEPQTPGASFNALPGMEFAPIVVHIEYCLRNPVDGFQFVLPNESYPHRVPHAYTTPSSPDSARCWVPCIDNLWEKSTWEFQFIVPRYLEDRPYADEDDADDGDGAIPTLVVCSGELVEQVAHPYNSNKTIFLFSQAVLTSVQHIAFAAGPFHLYTIPTDIVADDTTTSQPLMHAFCLPGHERLLSSSVSFLRSAMSFYTEFGSYPFGSYKLVAVEELPVQRFDSAAFTLFSTDLLHGDDAIEQAFEMRRALSHGLACQWVGINILPKTWSDTWLVNGLGLYITGLYLRKQLGNNDYRYKLKKDMQQVIERDNGSMPPICQPQIVDPPDVHMLPFINLKAPLVLHILDRRLGKSGTSLGLSRVLPKIFLSAISGEMLQSALSTHAFLRVCRKVSGVDPRSFAEQWIYGSGCPSFGFSASFNRKKMAVEISMRQESPAFKAMESNEVSKLLFKPVELFEGQMTIRIHEADGTPYEHVLDIRSQFKRYEVPFNTKYKRVRRNTKRYLARQAAAQAAAEGDSEAAEAMGMIDMGFGLDIWENPEERDHWRVADWTEEDESTMNGATYEWIRMDADFEWIANIGFDQPDFMWVSQLQRDRDVVAQLEAVSALARQPTAIVSSVLTKTILVSNYYYHIRCEAALALVNCAIRKLDFLGLFHLFKLFLRYCYEPEDPNQDLFSHSYVPTPNDFSDLSEYFVRKALVNAISRVRFENGKSPSVVRQFLIEQLRYNDNTANPYSDGYYICTLISAIGCATVSTSTPERGELLPSEVRSQHNAEDANLLKQALAEVDRYRSMDRLIPSTHNVVTIAALEFYLLLSLASLIPSDPKTFFPLTREGNYTRVRIAAFDGLFMTKWYPPPVMLYVLSVMANDPSRTIRRHVARSACQSLALLVALGDMKSSNKDSESLLIEEDGTNASKSKEPRKTEVDAMIKILRKDREIGKNEVIREYLMPVALAADADHEVRWCLLKLADILVRGVEEHPPTVKLHIPPTPSQENFSPVVVSSGKIAIKPQRSLKITGPPLKRPAISIPSTPSATKLKVSGHPSSLQTPKTPAPIARETTAAIPNLKPKAKKADHASAPVAKAQQRGMSLNDLRAARTALKKLKINKHAQLFLQPVDPIRDHAPNYFDIIKQPMDLSTMGAKLEAGHYKDRFAFEADFRLMVINAHEYNIAGSYPHSEANALKSFFDALWNRINKTLEQRNEAPAKVAPPAASRPPPPATPNVSSSTTPSASAARRTIKLKVPLKATPQPQPAPILPKVKLSKPKAPQSIPLELDDGSNDLLEEVIAIERQKDKEKQQRSLQAPQETPSTSKRKKSNVHSEDEDIIALATPPKRERQSDHGVHNNQALVSLQVKNPVPSNVKPKKDRPRENDAPTRPLPEAPRITVKGKEKEREAIPSPAPSEPRQSVPAPTPATSGSTPVNEKKVREVLKAVQKLPEYPIFSQPVDPIRDGCPTYLEEIAHPMDFGTMSMKLSQGKYSSMEDFASDAALVFSNCRHFNTPATYPVLCADAVEKVFRKEWEKAMEKKLSFSEKRGLLGLMTNLVKDGISWVFREPVDPVLLNIPHYFDIISRKDARDLKTIRQKLENDKYDSFDAFEADIELMVNNAIVFNGAESEVGKVGVILRDKVVEMLKDLKTGPNRKRKDGERINAPPNKKAKLV